MRRSSIQYHPPDVSISTNVSIAEVEIVTKPYVSCDLEDRFRMMPTALLVGIGTQYKSLPPIDGTRNNVDRDGASIFWCFKPHDITRQRRLCHGVSWHPPFQCFRGAPCWLFC